jgi:NADH:ubiquinone oxidoreductase subunit E
MKVVILRRIEQMKVSTVPFKGTQEQEAKLLEVIAKYKGQKGALMPIMQEAQEIYGYLPYQVQKIISDETGIPIEKIYGVATFYAQFSMSPKGKYVVSMCLGTACYVKGAGAILEEIEKVLKIEDGGCTPDGKFSLEVCRCVGACGLAPVMIVGGDVYGKMTPDRVADILAKYE